MNDISLSTISDDLGLSSLLTEQTLTLSSYTHLTLPTILLV